MSIFSHDMVNSSRQKELDLAKGLAIIFMVLVHVNEVYQSTTYQGGSYNQVIEFLGSPPAAPVFMFLLGLGIIYSRRSTAHYLFKRGIFMIILGYGLNFFRDYIPYTLLAVKDSDPSCKVEAFKNLMGIDILPFAGLSFLFFAFVKKFKVKIKYLPLIYMLFATLNLLLRDRSTGNYWADAFLGLIYGTYDYSWFPFLSWIVYPIMGYIFGYVLIHTKNKKILYKNCLIYSACLLIPLYIYCFINKVHFGDFGELYQETYYHHDMMGNFIMGTFVIFWISLLYFVMPYLSDKVMTHFSRWSKNINIIYCVHWIFLGYSMLILKTESYPPVIVCSIAFVIFIISDFISARISIFKKSHHLAMAA